MLAPFIAESTPEQDEKIRLYETLGFKLKRWTKDTLFTDGRSALAMMVRSTVGGYDARYIDSKGDVH